MQKPEIHTQFWLRLVTDTTFAMWTHVFSRELYRKYSREVRSSSHVRCANKRTDCLLRRRIVNILCWHQNCQYSIAQAHNSYETEVSISNILRRYPNRLWWVSSVLCVTQCDVSCVQQIAFRISVPCANPVRKSVPRSKHSPIRL